MLSAIKSKYDIIEECFSSRKSFEEKSYIKREYYENEYGKALLRSKCIIVRGCSGSGKSWLTKHILSEFKIKNETINLASVKMFGSLNEFFKSNISMIKTEYSEEKNAEISVAVAGGSVSTSNTFAVHHNYFLEYLKSKKGDYIVFENMESITNNCEIIEELGAMITMIDDSEVQSQRVKFIFIGTNSDIKGFFDKLPNSDTIANRIIELPEIKGFNRLECSNHVMNGFKKLKIKIKNESEFTDYIHKHTNGIPQNVNDLCTQISYQCIDNNFDTIEDVPTNQNKILQNAQQKWINEAFFSNYSQITNLFRSNSGDKAYNNYILYMLHEIPKIEFDVTFFQAKLSEYFGGKVDKVSRTKIKNYLKALSDESSNNNILENKGNDYFSIRNYKTILCIRNILYLDGDTVCIYDLSELSEF